jgi:uncharacterized membrane protein YccF (DUF307 family)
MATSNTPTIPPQTVVSEHVGGPGCLVQALWFLLVGWWLGGLVVALAWFLNNTIILLPFGVALLNNIPKVLALQDPTRRVQAISRQGSIVVSESDIPQINFFVRAAYFFLIGWWWSGVWLTVAYALCFTILLMPFGLAMFRLAPTMTTLKRY